MNALSPAADGGPMSHWTKGRSRRNAISLPFLNRAIRSQGHLNLRSQFRGAQEHLESSALQMLGFPGLQYLAEGNNGVAFVAKRAGAAFHNRLFGSLSSYVIGSPSNAPREVIIKVQALRKVRDIDDVRREVKLQLWIYSQSRSINGVKIDGRKLAPPIYYSGLLDTPHGMVFVTVMGRARGVNLRDFMKAKGLTASQYANIEKAIVSLWLLGAAHADLHPGNVFFDSKCNRTTIIDFGFGMVLPRQFVKKMEKYDLAEVAGNRAFYNDGLGSYMNQIQQGRGYAWYNPEGKLIRYLRGLVRDPQNIEDARHRAWGSSA